MAQICPFSDTSRATTVQCVHTEAFQETSWVSEPEEGESLKSTSRNSHSFDRAKKPTQLKQKTHKNPSKKKQTNQPILVYEKLPGLENIPPFHYYFSCNTNTRESLSLQCFEATG